MEPAPGRHRRRWWWIGFGAVVALLAAVSSVSLNPERRGRLVDETGAGVDGAFVFHYYSAGTKSVWPWAHHDGPFLTRTGPDGRFVIPRETHLRFPVIAWTSPVRHYVTVYVPRYHNACPLTQDGETVEPPAYCAVRLDRKPGRAAGWGWGEAQFRMRDLAAQAPARFHSLWLMLYSGEADAFTIADQRRQLYAAVRDDYQQFLSQYGTTVFENSPQGWPHIPVADWTREDGGNRPWVFFLREVPFYGVTMEDRVRHLH